MLLKDIVKQIISTWKVLIVVKKVCTLFILTQIICRLGNIQYLPYGRFKWLTKKEIGEFDLNSIGENSSIGYVLEVDLEYPVELHDLHDDYPLTPEKLVVKILF